MKQIIFKATMNGCGVVNFDDKSQKFTLNKLGIRDVVGNDNIKLAKKHFFKKKNEDGEDVYDYCIKISGDCIRKAIFNNEVECINPMVVNDDIIACNYYLSPVGLTRGYMNVASDNSGYKRKSCITVTDAKEISGAKSEFEIGTTSGDRNLTSMFFTEKVGETVYEFKGVIDFKTLMFVVADPMFDRMGVKGDWLTTGLAEKIMRNFYGDKSSPSVGYFTSSSKCLTTSIAEYGMILNEELVVYLTKYLLKNIMGCSIKRNNSYANVTSLSIKFVDDIIFDKMDDEDGWIELKSPSDVDKLDFKVDCPYEKATEEDIEKLSILKEEYNKTLSEIKKDKEEKKKANAEKRKNKKEASEE